MTRRCVTDEQYGQLHRRTEELVRRVDEGTLSFDKVMDALQATIESRFGGARVIFTFLRDMTQEGWVLLEDVEGDPVPANQLELVPFLNRRESYVPGEEMRKRAKQKNASLGQRQAEYLLEHQEEIPSQWRNYYLVFSGTVWRTSDGGLSVPDLGWRGERWSLGFRWLESHWDSGDRLLRPGK